jgi:cytochrome P450
LPEFLRDPLTVLRAGHAEHGPIFRVALPGRRFVVLAGVEANTFVSRWESENMTTRVHYGWMARELGSEEFVLTMDGAAHRHMRKILRPGYSRQQVLDRLPQLVHFADRVLDEWHPGAKPRLLRDLRRIVIDQLGYSVGGRPAGHLVDELWCMLDTILRVTAVRASPRIALLRPRYRRARRRVQEFVTSTIEAHRLSPPGERPADHIDDLLAARDEAGRPLADEVIRTAALGPFVAGIDTVANTLAFLLYGILANPRVAARVIAEVDELFAGPLISERLRLLTTLHGAAMETLRLFPVTPAVVRTATRDLEFAGVRIPAGTDLLVATAVSHFDPGIFADPEVFDPDRFLEPRREHKKVPNAYAPFAVGPHTCLGAGIAEVVLALGAARILHRWELELDPPDFRMRTVSIPITRPADDFAVRVRGERHPGGTPRHAGSWR